MWEMATVSWKNGKDIKKTGQESWKLILEYAKSSEYILKSNKSSKTLKIQSYNFIDKFPLIDFGQPTKLLKKAKITPNSNIGDLVLDLDITNVGSFKLDLTPKQKQNSIYSLKSIEYKGTYGNFKFP